MGVEDKVVIVGAGPTGLALSAELKKLGIPSLVLERLATAATTSRALAIHARTLEVLESLQVTDELINKGIKIDKASIRDRNQILASISFRDLDTQYPYVLVCPQQETEAILKHRLESLGGNIHRSCEVVSIQNGEKVVDIQYKEAGVLKTIQTEWLVGCDGIHSVVREQVGIDFIGSPYEEIFVLADVEMDWPLGREELSLFLTKEGLLAVIPIPGNLYRIIATVESDANALSIEAFQDILMRKGPENIKIEILSMKWASRFHIQHRIANMMRKGRVLLAGDSAHVHSPAGGQGMNTGIQDAISLAEALKEAMNGNKNALETWQKRRLEIAHSVIKLTDRLTKIATITTPSLKFLRNTIIRLIGHVPYLQHEIAKKLSELDNR